eukprot:13573579-Ditylum_brightwellii.AAC.1
MTTQGSSVSSTERALCGTKEVSQPCCSYHVLPELACYKEGWGLRTTGSHHAIRTAWLSARSQLRLAFSG